MKVISVYYPIEMQIVTGQLLKLGGEATEMVALYIAPVHIA
jgi:hypothetical protein